MSIKVHGEKDMPLSLIVVAIVFMLIAVRQIGSVKIAIWQVMLGGAVVVIVGGAISPREAYHAISFDVLLFLFGVFVLGNALEESGYLFYLSYHIFKRARSVDALVLMILFVVGGASALLMNDTLAIIGTPVMLLISRRFNISSKLLLLALAFGVTIGSAMSPIGNPQNLLIALNGGIREPFVTFLSRLFIPTLLNLLAAYAILRLFYTREFHPEDLNHEEERVSDERLAFLARVGLGIFIFMIIIRVTFVMLNVKCCISLTWISLSGAAPLLIFSRKRLHILRGIDWHTLVFFTAMFVLMQSVWDCGVFQHLIETSQINVISISMIFLVSILLSQVISNVPLVALYIPVILHAGGATTEMVALAAGSTIAGNFFILGAASNVIIIQNAEKRGNHSLTFLEFARAGIPLTLINFFVYWVFLVKL